MSGGRRVMPAWSGPGRAAPPDRAATRLPAVRRARRARRAGRNFYRVLAHGAAIFWELLPGQGKTPRGWSGNGSVGSCGSAGPRVAWYQSLLRIRSAMEVSAVRKRLDPRVHDSVAFDEIELVAEVLSAVAASDHRLTPEELDEVLGVKSVA